MLYRAHPRSRLLLKVVIVMWGLTISAQYSQAAPFKPKDAKISPSSFFSKSVTYTYKKKSLSKIVACYQSKPGKTYTKKSVLYFRSLKDDVKLANEELKRNSRNKRKAAASKAKLDQLKALSKAANPSCLVPPGTEQPPPSNPSPPSFADTFLEQYTGPFGEAQARHLLNRLGMGASIEEIERAVSMGLQGTVDDIFTWKEEPNLEAYFRDIECDGRPPTDPENLTCNPNNPNNLSTLGYRFAWYYGAINSQNQLFYRLFLMLHDDFMTASTDGLSWCDQWAQKTYRDMIWSATRSGNIRQFMKEYMSDQMGALRYLNLGSSRAPVPNQNFARELWQLGTIGQVRPGTNSINYDELDIIGASNVLAGWSIESFENPYGFWVCYGAKIPGLSVPGAQVIFHGTPYQTLVSTPDELLEATLRHPSAAESMANKLYQNFVAPGDAPPAVLQGLAQVIRENGFNLHAGIRRLILSKGFYDQRNFRTVYKHPLQLAIGFLRQTKVPFDSYWQLEEIMSGLGQRPYEPESVFGWYPDKLAGEAFVLERRNAFNWFNTYGGENFRAKGFSYFDRFLTNLPGDQSPSVATINRVSRMLGVPLNGTQIAHLDEYLNFRLTTSGCPSQCGGQPTRVVRDAFDPFISETNGSGNWGRQIRGLLNILTAMPQYQVN